MSEVASEESTSMEAAEEYEQQQQQQHHYAQHEYTSTLQILKSATVSSVQILVLVFAGTSGFLISLLGLIIPNKLRQRPQASSSFTSPSGTSSRHRSSSSRRTSATPSLHSYANSSTTGTRSSSSSSHAQGLEQHTLIPSSRTAAKNTTHTRTWPMSRGNSGNSSSTAAAGIPELNHSSTASCSGSCSSSIISEGVIEPLHAVQSVQGEANVHGMTSFFNKCKNNHHFNRSRKNSRVSLHAEEEDDSLATIENTDKNKTSRRSRTRSMSPRSISNSKISADAVRARLSLIIPHHNHSNNSSSPSSTPSTSKEPEKRNRRSSFILRRSASPTLSNGSNTSSPVLGPSRSSTMQDTEAVSHEEVSSSGNTHSKKITTIPAEGGHTARPPFLTRMFTFSSSSSSSSAGASSSSKSSSNISSNTSSTSNTHNQRVSVEKSNSHNSASPANVTEQDIPVEVSAAAIAIAARPKTRRLSTRLTSFRSSSSKSRRVISEGEAHTQSHLPSSAEVVSHEEVETLSSPPQTPRLDDSVHTFQQGEASESTTTPLRSPLIKRSFFVNGTQSPSSSKTLNVTTSSPSTLKKERPYSPRRVASESYHQTHSHSSNTAHSVQTMNSPGKVDRHTTMNALKMGVLPSPSPSLPAAAAPAVLSSSSAAAPTGSIAPALPLQRGRTVYGRFQSDAPTPASHGILQSRYPSSSPSQQHQQQAQLQRHARHVSETSAPAPRASSASSPPGLATSTNMSMNNNTRNKTNNGQSFIPFVPFSDVQYRKSTLDLSGGSALTMSVHFEEQSR